jgi:hypothetical protein
VNIAKLPELVASHEVATSYALLAEIDRILTFQFLLNAQGRGIDGL